MSYNPNPNPSGPAYNPGGPYNQGGPSAPMVSQAGIQDVINSWTAALTRPSVQTFAGELARYSQNRLLMSVGLATVVAAILGLVNGALHGGIVGGFLGALIGTPIGFFIGQGVVWIIAKVFGGTGDYMQQSWVMSTFWAPILILGNIPFIGGILGAVGALYSIYLTYLALQPAQRLDSQRSLFVILTLVAIGIVLGICAVVLGAAAIFGLAATSR